MKCFAVVIMMVKLKWQELAHTVDIDCFCWSGRAEKCEAQYVMLSAITKKQ